MKIDEDPMITLWLVWLILDAVFLSVDFWASTKDEITWAFWPIAIIGGILIFFSFFLGNLFVNCTKCGQRVGRKDSFCRKCGAPLTNREDHRSSLTVGSKAPHEKG